MENKELVEIISAVIDAKMDRIQPQTQSSNIAELATDLSKLQSEITTISPNRENKYANYKYGDLDALFVKVRPLLGSYGFSIVPEELEINDQKYLKTMLLHKSGQWKSTCVKMIITPNIKRKSPIQDYGTSLSYHKRYSMANLLGLTIAVKSLTSTIPLYRFKFIILLRKVWRTLEL